jgi:hypothetical protein
MEENTANRICSYADACCVLGEEPIVDFGNDTKDEISYKKLKTIVKALNDGWEADYRNKLQRKWLPQFAVSFGLFRFLEPACITHLPFAGDTKRLCLKNSELAEYAGRTFVTIWEDFLL